MSLLRAAVREVLAQHLQQVMEVLPHPVPAGAEEEPLWLLVVAAIPGEVDMRVRSRSRIRLNKPV
jgi:hypothetical protein